MKKEKYLSFRTWSLWIAASQGACIVFSLETSIIVVVRGNWNAKTKKKRGLKIMEESEVKAKLFII